MAQGVTAKREAYSKTKCCTSTYQSLILRFCYNISGFATAMLQQLLQQNVQQNAAETP